MLLLGFWVVFMFFSLLVLLGLALVDLPCVVVVSLGTLFRFDYSHFWLFLDYYSLIYLFVLSCMVGSVLFFLWVMCLSNWTWFVL